MKHAPLWPAPGNHDYGNSGTLQDSHVMPYYDIFNVPVAGEAGGVPSGTEAFYSYNYGNVHFLALDSYGEESNMRLYDTTGAQAVWVKQDLAANTLPWVVVYWHHPPYTKGSHNSDTEGDLISMRQNFIRILERFGVDLILCGHSHSYERSKLMKGHYGNEASFNAGTHNLSSSSALYDGTTNSCPYMKDDQHAGEDGTVYVVSGSSGQLGGTSSGYPHNAMFYSNETNGGSMVLEFNDNRMDAKWICSDGVIRDKFTIVKDANQVQNYTINAGDTLNFTASWNGQYNWPHSGETSQTIQVIPSASTSYTVLDQYGCLMDSFLVTVNVVPPVSSFNTSSNNICAGQSITLTNTSTNTNSISWSIPGGSPSSGSTSPLNVSFATAGTYVVTLTATNTSGTNTSSQTITVNPNPSANASNTGPYCSGNTIQLSSVGGTSTDDWIGPLSFSQTDTQNPSIGSSTTSMSGLYTVTVTNAFGCSATATTVVIVNNTPTASASNTGPYCPGNTIQLSSTGSGTYSWSGPAAFSNTAQNPSIPSASIANDGIYTVAVTIGSCSSTSTTQVVVANSSSANAANTGPYCEGETIILNSISGATSYAWSGPVAFSSSIQSPSIMGGVVAMSGVYPVTTTLASGCSVTGTTVVTVNTNPIVPIITPSGPTTFCDGDTINLSSSYLNGNTWSTTATSQSILVNSSGSYAVTETDLNGCTSSSTILVTVNSLTTVNLGALSTVCVNYPEFALTSGTPSGGIYSGPGVSSGQFNHISAGTGTHTVSYTFTDANGCLSTAASSITVSPCLGTEETSNQYLLSAYPNPFSEFININYHLSQEEEINIHVVDISGKIVANLLSKKSKQAGDYTITINADQYSLSSGVYFIQLSTTDSVEVIKINYTGK